MSELPTASITTPSDDHTPDPLLGTTLADRYHMLGRLGEGAFGIVYEAEQRSPVTRRVAIKVIKPGMDSKAVVARFRAEEQALAVMNHPGIARVFDAGETERGLPFFAMELVKGEPVTEFCDRNTFSIEQRLELIIEIAHAVQHAHTKGVIHRDLKPSNILVGYDDQGQARPKIIDFGVAKALNQRLTEQTLFTDRGQLIGTPEYMSPEQAEMSGVDIDTRADVYSLGVLLYELLTGVRPFDLKRAAFHDIQRVIRETEPPKPSTRVKTMLANQSNADTASKIVKLRQANPKALARQLRRDLDWVTIKCLEKDRSRRYTTPIELAEELRSYLNGNPVRRTARTPHERLVRHFRLNHAVYTNVLLAYILFHLVQVVVFLIMYSIIEEDGTIDNLVPVFYNALGLLAAFVAVGLLMIKRTTRNWIALALGIAMFVVYFLAMIFPGDS